MLHSTSIVNGAADALVGFREVNNSFDVVACVL